jgi:hypothetical protein
MIDIFNVPQSVYPLNFLSVSTESSGIREGAHDFLSVYKTIPVPLLSAYPETGFESPHSELERPLLF